MSRVLRLFLRSLAIVALAIVVVAQDGEILPGASLIVDGIPKIPASLLIPANSYGNTYAYSLLGWDPEKAEVIVLRTSPKSSDIARISIAGESPVGFAYLPRGCYGTFYQPQGKSLIFMADT